MKVELLAVSILIGIASCNILNVGDNFNHSLYNSIIAGDYDYAVELSKDIVTNDVNNIYIIKDTVTTLLNDAEANTISFAYKLWTTGEIAIVKNFFPIQFWLILDDKEFNFINKHDKLYMSLSNDENESGEREAYGDKQYEQDNWKLIPVWESNKVHFKIYNTKFYSYLKMGEVISDNDRQVFGSAEEKDHKSQWFIQAKYLNEELLFFVYNRKHRQALKIGKDVESNEDHKIYGADGDVFEKPDSFGWLIETIQ